LGAARGGRGADEAEVFERAARAFANGTHDGTRDQRTIWPDQMWPIGERVVEIATGKAFWIDEHHPTRGDLIGVIPDEGTATMQWIAKAALRRSQRNRG
jgi:hypothetical protein